MRIKLTVLLILLLFSKNTLSVTFSGFDVTHCLECGEILVGATRLESSSITSVSAGSISVTGGNFDFTGKGSWEATAPKDSWWFYTSKQLLANGSPRNKMGFSFSPNSEGIKEGTYLDANLPGTGTSSVKFTGTGVADTSNSVQLDIQPSIPVNGSCDGNICTINISEKGSLTFKVTPKISSLPVGLNPEWHKHIKFHFDAKEYDTDCYSFTEQIPARKLDSNEDYFDYLGKDSSRTSRARECTYNFTERTFIASVDKTLNFVSTNQSATGNGYVEYLFYAEGHYNFSTRNCVDNTGCKIYRVSANGTAPPPVTTDPQLTVKIAGNGKGSVVSSPTGINCSTGTCNYNFPTTTSINLTATPDNNSTFDGWNDSSCASQFQLTPSGKTCTVTFSPQIVTPTKAILTVAVVNGAGGTVTSSDSVISCPSVCSATYDKDATTTLTPIASTGYKFESWSADCAAGGANDIITVTVDQNKTCLVTFVQKIITPVVDKACFTMEYIDDRVNFATDEIRKVKLDASCSGTYSQYKWRLYDTADVIKVTLPTTATVALHEQFAQRVLPDGNYIVTLIVGEGESQDQIAQTLTIPPLLAKFKTSLDSQKIEVDATLSSKSKDSGTISYQWWIGYLGRITPDILGIIMSPSQNQWTIDYADKSIAITGNYYETITLAITDSKGRTSTTSQKAKVNLPAPVIIDDFSFVGNPTTNTDGTITVTLRGQATDPDGGVVTYKFVDSYCEPNNCLKPQVSIVTDSEGKEWQQATFNYANQKPIADAYLLQVTDNEVGNDQTTASKILRLDLPKLTSATINNKGNFGNTSTIFHGGVSTDGGKTYQNPVAVKLNQPLAIRGYFEVDSLDINQLADILLIIGIELQPPFDGGTDTTYVSFGATGTTSPVELYKSPDVWMAQLTNPFLEKSVTLATEMPLAQNLNLQLFTGTPASFQWQPNTQMYFFLGYRLLDSKSEGKIVYSSQPVTLKIEP